MEPVEPPRRPIGSLRHTLILIVSIVPLSWLCMMLVHEFGHAMAGLATGGTVRRVVFHPLAFSRTDVDPNPWPLVVVWAGPVIGAVLPLAMWGIARWRRWPLAYLLRFFAGFCLLANGEYIAFGSIDGVGDAGDMLRRGSARWELWLFGLVAAPLGLLLWHGLGPAFGLGKNGRSVHPAAAWGVLALLIIIAGAGFLLGNRGT